MQTSRAVARSLVRRPFTQGQKRFNSAKFYEARPEYNISPSQYRLRGCHPQERFWMVIISIFSCWEFLRKRPCEHEDVPNPMHEYEMRKYREMCVEALKDADLWPIDEEEDEDEE
eukprot:NODE_2869_length_489_cov_54.193370_g2819_i0.p2 GENE.NODE_2869_length_489_cov_54.193370_g2819_i0~~NODE_2869_length_489_cov_54.193370_g2819_i0.p2  ORF type:complete len:115 (+),score=19.27 NODE_2869_length_489_cov_54.193370_g2819_i0:60-404(+)